MCGVYNIVYMGTVNNGSKTWQVYNIVYMGAVNNGSKTWHVWSVQHCLHGYSQQWQHCMGAVNNGSKTWLVWSVHVYMHVWSVQHCLHGCSQQWQQDMACVECTTLFTWVQSTMAARHGMCGVYNIVYMGAVNNGSKTWLVWSVQHCLHGYSQQWQQDMACVECTTLFTWVQSTMAARHGLCGVYNIVYMSAVNNGSKTWLVWSVQHCLHGCSQQWQQDMACVECTTLFTWVQSTMTQDMACVECTTLFT